MTVTVMLAGVNAIIMSANDSQIVVMAGEKVASNMSEDVTIVADTGANATNASAWMYLVPGNTLVGYFLFSQIRFWFWFCILN